MKVNYQRCSTKEQNVARQVIQGMDAVFTDYCSGGIEFSKREQSSKLLKLVEQGKVSELHIDSLDRLGRNTIDMLNTINHLTEKNVCVVSIKEGLRTLVDGKQNAVSKLMVGLLSTLAEFELSKIRDRANEGILKAKERGAYKGNGNVRTSESIEAFMSKDNSRQIKRYLNQGYSIRTTAKMSGCSTGKVAKVKKYIDNLC
jgi:DNA invertase Pin-like site-specific DNA recombinase